MRREMSQAETGDPSPALLRIGTVGEALAGLPVAVVVSFASCAALSPSPEEAEVAKGMTVLPVKSLAITKAFTGHAAPPHQMG